MQVYETIDIWNSIQKIIEEWIESVILEGWNVYREKEILEKTAEKLTKKIVRTLTEDFGIPTSEIMRLMDKFFPEIFSWIDEILLISWDFYSQNGKLKEFSIMLTKTLIRLFLEEEDFIEYI